MPPLYRSCLAALLVVCAAVCQAQTAAPAHLVLGRELLTALRPENTGYRHKGWVRWPNDPPGVEAQVFTDCSGLINALLERTGHPQLERMRAVTRRDIPKARDYYRQIVAENGFTRIAKIQDAQPGDLLVIGYPADSENTGHSMLIDAEPIRRTAPSAPIIGGTVQWEVAVIDSTASPHGRRDSRYGNGAEKGNGAGRGVIRLYTDTEGHPVGHSWSLLASSRYQDEATKPLAIGRLH